MVPPSLPSFVTPQFKEVLRTTLPTGKEGVVHLFVVHGYQGAEEDAERLLLTDKLLQAVLAEAQVVCIGQLLFIAGDLNADPAVIPCFANGISAGRYVELALACSLGLVLLLMLLVRSNGRMVLVRVGILLSVVLMRWLLPLLARSQIGGSLFIFLCLLAFVLIRGRPILLARRCVSRSGLLVGWILLISPPLLLLVLSRMSGICTGRSLEWFLLKLFLLLGMQSPGLLWLIFRLLGAVTLWRVYFRLTLKLVVYHVFAAGGGAFGGRGSSRLCKASQEDEVDVRCSQYFVNSSLAHVVLFRRCLKSVSDVLKGIRNKGFTQSRCSSGLLGCCMSSWSVWSYLFPLIPGIGVVLLIYTIATGGFDSLEVLNGFNKQVVVNRRDMGVPKWTNWLREDLGSRPYAWLGPDFVPPSPYLVVKDPHTQSSQILVEPRLIDAEFRKAWMLFFCRSGHPVVTVDQFWGEERRGCWSSSASGALV